MKPYSQDLREKIIQALEAQEETQSDIADRFAVSLSFVEKLWRQWQTTGICAAKPHSGGQQRRLRDHSETLRNAVAKQPDATLEELSDQIVEAKGPQVYRSTVCRELQRLQLPLKKKSLHASERDTLRVERLRAEYRREICACEVTQLKFIDEAGATLAMTRLYGRARPGERVVNSVPQNYGSSQTMLACLSLGGVSAPWVIEGAACGGSLPHLGARSAWPDSPTWGRCCDG